MSTEVSGNASVKLEPFLLMAKSAKGAAAAKLVQDATAAPGVFVFAELLETPNVQELANGDHAQHFALLQLFCYKTYEDYIKNRETLPPLNPAQITKLKYLTLVSLSMERRIIPYAYLMQVLQMPTLRELEDLIIDAIYADLIRGKLDQKEQQFEVEYTIGRDVEPGKVESLLSALQDWAKTTSSVLNALDKKLDSLAAQKAYEKAQNEKLDKTYETNLKQVSDKIKENKAFKKMTSIPGFGGDDRMEVDESPAVVEKGGRSRKPLSPNDNSKQPRKRNRF